MKHNIAQNRIQNTSALSFSWSWTTHSAVVKQAIKCTELTECLAKSMLLRYMVVLLISIFLLNPKSMHAIRIVCLVIITNSKESEKLRPKYSNNSAAGHVSFFGRILHYFKWEISIISLVIKSYDKFPLYNVYIQVKDMSTGVL